MFTGTAPLGTVAPTIAALFAPAQPSLPTDVIHYGTAGNAALLVDCGARARGFLLVKSETSLSVVDALPLPPVSAARETTESERVAGELRRWGMLESDWDGEGAATPDRNSISSAITFLHLASTKELPEPMLHANGHAGLLWRSDDLYADIEFLGNARVAYYIERGQGKHKGVVSFDRKKIPDVLATLIQG